MRYALHMSFICSINLPRLPNSVQEQILEQNLKKKPLSLEGLSQGEGLVSLPRSDWP